MQSRLSKRLVALIAARPGIRAAEPRTALPDVSAAAIHAAVYRLRAAHKLTRVAYGRYRIAPEAQVEPSTPFATAPLGRWSAARCLASARDLADRLRRSGSCKRGAPDCC